MSSARLALLCFSSLLLTLHATPTPAQTPAMAYMQAPAVHDCLERSLSLTEQTYPAFHADCETAPVYDIDALQTCANSSGPYCQGLVKRMAEPDGSLAFVTSNRSRAIFVRKAFRSRLNRDPVVELLILDGERDQTYLQQVLVLGCGQAHGLIQFLKDRPRSDSPFEVMFHVAWSPAGPDEPDQLGRYVCKRDEASP